MNIATAIRERLLEMAPLTALVGARVYVDVLGQKPTLPAVRVQRIDEDEDMHLRGPVGVHRARVQVDAVGTSKASADAVDEAVRGDGLGTGATGLLGWAGSVGGSPGVIDVLSILPLGVQEFYNAAELREYVIARDFRVTWREAA